CLRDLDYGCDIEPFDGHFDRARWIWRALVLSQPRIELIQLPHLSVGSPCRVAGAGIAQVGVRELIEPACAVKDRSALISERLVLDAAARAQGSNSLFVKAHRVEVAGFDPRNFGRYQRGTVLEILRTDLRPFAQLPVMAGERLDVLLRTHGL